MVKIVRRAKRGGVPKCLGKYDPNSGECRLCPEDSLNIYKMCLAKTEKEERKMAKVVIAKSKKVEVAPVAKGKKTVTTAVKGGGVKKVASIASTGEWREGSGAQLILESVRKLRKASAEKVVKFLGTKLESADPVKRVKHILDQAASRGLVQKVNGEYIA